MKLCAKKNLLGIDLQELTEIAQAHGQPPYRGRQLFDAVYRQRISDLHEITTLPLGFREQLGEQFCLAVPVIDAKFQSSDGTVRYLLRLQDGQSVEAVWMPEGDDGESGDGSQAGEEEASGEAADEKAPGQRPGWRRGNSSASPARPAVP